MTSGWVACFRIPAIGIASERGRLPHLWGEPFALAGLDAMLKAVSPECYPFGIAAGQSVQAARSMCQGLIVLPYDRHEYMRAAEAIWDVIATETSVVEPVEPEAVFAEFTGQQHEVCSRARQIAALISSKAITTVRVGIGRSKLVARQAALQERRASDVISVPVGREAAALASLPLVALPHKLDAKLLQRLEKLGVLTLGDVAALPESVLLHHRKLRDVWHLLRQLAIGNDGDRVRPLWPKPKIERSYRFDEETDSEALVEEVLHRLAFSIGAELQRHSVGLAYCRTLALNVGMDGGAYTQETERLLFPTHDSGMLHAAALRLFGRMRSANMIEHPVAELLLTASDLDTGSQSQLAFTALDEESAKREQQARLESTLGRIWRRFGPRAVVTAALLSQAQRIHLWTHTLARMRREPIRVYTDRHGAPLRYLRRGRGAGRRKDIDSYEVMAVLDNWRMTQWRWDTLIESDCWRVIATPEGIHELHRHDIEWVLEAEAD